MKRFERQRTPAVHAAIGFALVAVFATDLATPLGVAEWVFYLVPVALTLYVWRPRTPIVVAAVSTLLITLGVTFSPPAPPGLPPWIPMANRAMAALAIWAVALVARRSILSRLSLREQDWLRSGQRELSARMQGEQSMVELCDNVLTFLCHYLDVPVGALYVEESGSFRRGATYAVGSALPSTPELLTPGDSLLGQAIRDRRIVQLGKLPPDYLPISSALGMTRPTHVVMAPVEVDGAVRGAVELGLLHAAGRSEMDLLETTAQAIAIAIRSAQYRTRQAELLEQTQRQAEELQSQQEELRVSNEELEEQSRALKESQARLESQQAELEQTNSQLEQQAAVLEEQRDNLSRAQAELVEKAEALERTNQYKSEFLANMSHELRTPLNSALILAKLLADNKDGNLTEDQVKFASTIHSSGNDLLTLINDVLDLSRIEAGRVEIHPEQVTVANVLAAMDKTFHPLASEKKLGLELVAADNAPASLETDGLRLQQILRNLLSNAVKFTERGQVSLHVSGAPDGRVAFAVSDTGIGIPADQHEVIFDAFRQADGSTHRRYGGTGLGLTISRELARRLGGALTIDSEVGKGSTFTLVIPVAPIDETVPERNAAPAGLRAEPLPAPRPSSVPPPRTSATPAAEVPAVEDDREALSPGDRTILVIEDDARFAAILRDLAREQQFRSLVATTGAEGLALAEQFVPSAVLLDIHLPDQSGLSLLEQLKRSASTRHIPVHIVSVSDYTQQALELGAVGYALKPVKREQLVGAIRRLEQKLEQKVRRVLVVEDVPAQRESIEALLRGQDVQIESAGRGEEALKLLGENTFDCMVLDLVLPGMSGYELLEKMASGAAFSFPPVIVYTGRALTREEEARLRTFASSIIIKGARSPERLLDEVSLFLHQVEAKLPPEHQRVLRDLRQREAAFEGRTILAVEDDARNIFALSSILEPKGAKLLIARNGREALDLLDRVSKTPADTVDLVLMDIMMPVMDGLTATRGIRRRNEWKKLPIIALTAKAMPEDRQRCLEAGANDYIAKPLDIDKLVSLVKVWLPK